MKDKKYYSGSVAVTTWRSRKTVKGFNDVISSRSTETITFEDGRCTALYWLLPIDARERYTKEEIVEAITTAWDKGEYAEDKTDISWIFNPDPEGFTGTVDLATVLLKDIDGNNGGYREQVRGRCRLRIVDGTFFEKLDGSSKLADIFKNYRYTFSTEGDIAKYVKGKWCVGDFGNDASYYILEIEEG